MEFLRDTGWQAVIGLLGIVVAVVTYLLSRSRKKLVYSLLAETPLLSVNDEVKGKIKIAYESKDIQNLYLVILRIENRGNVHISASDYEKPIIFSFPNSEILSAETTEVFPKNLKPVINTDSSTLTVNPLLLNKRDYITIKLIFSTYGKQVNVDARIIGVKDIEKIDSGSSSFAPPWAIALLLLLLAGISVLLALFTTVIFTIDEIVFSLILVEVLMVLAWISVYGSALYLYIILEKEKKT